MVKGVTRQVVVVRSPDPELFEQAIFIVRGDGVRAITEQDVLEQARRAAGGYVFGCTDGAQRTQMRIRYALFALLGAGAVALIWALCAVF